MEEVCSPPANGAPPQMAHRVQTAHPSPADSHAPRWGTCYPVTVTVTPLEREQAAPGNDAVTLLPALKPREFAAPQFEDGKPSGIAVG